MKDITLATDEVNLKMGKGFSDTLGLQKVTVKTSNFYNRSTAFIKRILGLDRDTFNMILTLTGPDGKIKDQRFIHNTVTTAGKQGVADQILAAPTLAKMGWMAIGTSTPSATLLGAEIDRNAFTSKTRSGAVVTVVGDWAAGDGTGAITEAGTFDVVTANTVNMWMSASFSVINKGSLDTLSVSWTLTIS